jgi:succinate dehydrogenase/fumarate reductase cytochrome b subunit
LPLGAYLVLHLVVTSSATGGRRAFVDGMVGLGTGVPLLLEVFLVFIPLVTHIVLGISMWARPGEEAASPQPSAGFRTLQRATGIAVLVFLAFHLGHTFVLGLGGADGYVIYDRLRADMGTPLYLGVYVVGTAAVALHLATGLPAAARRFRVVRSDATMRTARIASAAVAVVLFALAINTMGHFAVGVAFVGQDQESGR